MVFLEAHVPVRMELDGLQRLFFVSPGTIERSFADKMGKIIPDKYVKKLSSLLAKVLCRCMEVKSGEYETHIVEWSDVLCVGLTVNVQSTDDGVLYLNVIKVRPCFVGRGMLQIIVYILIMVAILRKDVRRVVVDKCVETTVSVLKAKFTSMFDVKTDTDGYNSCVFSGFDGMDWKKLKTQLGLDSRLRINDSDGVITKIGLIESAYPTAEELNNRNYVEKNFKLPVSVEILAREQAMEDVFSGRRGGVKEDYITGQLGPMFKRLYRGVYGGDKLPILCMDRIEFDSDVAYMNITYDDAKKRFQISDVAVRPCFVVFGIVHLVVLQLMGATRNCLNGNEIKICVECDRIIGRSLVNVFGRAVGAGNLHSNENMTASTSTAPGSVGAGTSSSGRFDLEIAFVDAYDFVDILDDFADQLLDDDDGYMLALDKGGFPTAGELNGVIAVEKAKLLTEIDANITTTAGELNGMSVGSGTV
jgi:hypothetical protein